MKGKRVFLFKTESGSEYLVVLTPAGGRGIQPRSFEIPLLVQLVGGNRRKEGWVAPKVPRVGESFNAFFRDKWFRTSKVVEVREI